jgi:hypothetical protein
VGGGGFWGGGGGGGRGAFRAGPPRPPPPPPPSPPQGFRRARAGHAFVIKSLILGAGAGVRVGALGARAPALGALVSERYRGALALACPAALGAAPGAGFARDAWAPPPAGGRADAALRAAALHASVLIDETSGAAPAWLHFSEAWAAAARCANRLASGAGAAAREPAPSTLDARVLLALVAVAGPLFREKYGLREALKLAFAAGRALAAAAARAPLLKADAVAQSTLLTTLMREEPRALLAANPERHGDLFDRTGWLLEDEPQSAEAARERRR